MAGFTVQTCNVALGSATTTASVNTPSSSSTSSGFISGSPPSTTGRLPLVLLLVVLGCLLSNHPCDAWSFNSLNHANGAKGQDLSPASSRRSFVASSAVVLATGILPRTSRAEESTDIAEALSEVQVSLEGDAKKLFNEGRAMELQGNLAAAQRLYTRVTKLAPRFIYGWSNLGNTQTAYGDLDSAEASYSTAINLCDENLRTTEESIGTRRCSDLYVLHLNRGSLRLNHNMPKEALADLLKSDFLRARPDAVVLQNLARAKEVNGLYLSADRDYTVAISMSSDAVNPFWLRSALVKFQLGDVQGGFDLLKRVENRFPDAPEVRAAYATFLSARGDDIEAQRKFLEIPDRQRRKYVDKEYLTKTITWPPKMIDSLGKVTSAIGDTFKASSS